MNDENERILDLGFANATITMLQRERDEARAAIANANNSLFGSQGFFLSIDGGEPDPHHLAKAIEDLKGTARAYYRERDDAEARGYERGVKEAAKVVEVTADKFSSERTIRTIRALLEKPND